ncbi:MAG: hypothetical protein KAY00_02195 [Agitococcus sp.]|jgi:hypothetical protein|nr:hypothetical protein [Agitococcus sp.]
MNANRTTKFKVSQIAGSLRMEGIVVSVRDESVMAGIVDGKINAAEQRQRLVEQYKKQNSVIT